MNPTTYANVRPQPQEGWVAAPGTAGISQRVTSDQQDARLAATTLRVLEPLETPGCSVNEY
jgi:hypothetical protein